jgi:ABC-2 type transport system ATP-binding protein
VPAIEADGLRKVYGPSVAVDLLTLAVRHGEVFGFLGPNGAGKTTTIHMLLDLVRPTSGRATVLGGRPGDPKVMARVGFLPEHFRFPPWLSARGLLDVHGRLHGMRDDERGARIGAVLERVGLAHWADSRVGTFSKGMSQRIGLAQALLAEPQVVFLDEPTSALDPLGRREVRDIIRELKGAGVTVFLNSHLLSEVEVTCDRVGIVRAGRMVRSGSLAELTGPVTDVEIRATGLTAGHIGQLAQWGEVLSEEPGALVMRVADEERVPAIAAMLVESGVRLYGLSPRRLSLEELFVRIVEHEP